MSTFADGQRVRCVDAAGTYGHLSEGAEYTIYASVIDEDGELVQLAELPRGVNDDGYPLHEYMPDRFEAVR